MSNVIADILTRGIRGELSTANFFLIRVGCKQILIRGIVRIFLAWAGRTSTTSAQLMCTHSMHPHHIYIVDNRSCMVWVTVVHTTWYPTPCITRKCTHTTCSQHNQCYPRHVHMLSTAYFPQHICRPHHMHRIDIPTTYKNYIHTIKLSQPITDNGHRVYF